jgi:hypothetical protein
MGSPFLMVIIAACTTSASIHPPPRVPMIEPSSRTSILAPCFCGDEPRHSTIVAMAEALPCLLSFSTSS